MAKKKIASTTPPTPMAPAPDGKPFHADSVLTCDGCGREVAVGFGGWRNLDTHKKSREHAARLPRLDKLPAVKKLKNGDISSFFKSPRPFSAPAPAKLGTQTAATPDNNSNALAPAPHASDDVSPPPSPEPERQAPSRLRQPDCPLVASLRSEIARIPTSLPFATSDDVFHKYAVPPVLHPSMEREELWMEINKTLDRDIGYGKRPEDLVPMLRRGEHGLNGFADYINECIVVIGFDAALFEMRIERVISAVKLIPGFPASSTSLATPGQALPIIDLTLDEIEASPPSPSFHRVPVTASVQEPSSQLASSRPVPCLGTHVALPEGISAGQSHEWGMETSMALRWRGNVFEGRLYIQAKTCLGFNALRSPCVDCEAVFPSQSVQNLIRRILHGVHESTNTTNLSWKNMRESNERLRRENNGRKLNALSLARKLTRITSKLDTHKRLVYAIADGNVPRVQVVVSVALRNKRGASGILQQLKRAQEQVYRPRSFTEADYSLSTLILRLGGDAALGVASRACGLPTRSTVLRHSRVPALRISHGYPTPDDVSANIDAVFPETILPPAFGTKVGLVLMIDETKLEERLRWDPRTNAIVGTCREHSGHLDLIFRSMDQAYAVANSLQTERAHYATEMTVAALGLLVPNSREQVARPIHISGTCKRENAKEHATLISTLIDASTTHAKLANARIICIATDGEAKRGSALVPLTLCYSLSVSSPLHAILSRLPLFNLLCGKNAITLDKDYKHLFKRYRGMLLRLGCC